VLQGSIVSEAGIDELGELIDGFLGVMAVGGDAQEGAFDGGEDDHLHDALAVGLGGLGRLGLDADLGLELIGEVDKLHGGPGVQAKPVADDDISGNGGHRVDSGFGLFHGRSGPAVWGLFALVSLIEQFGDDFTGIALAEEPSEGVLLEAGEDDVHRLEVLLRLILRRKQEDDAVDGLMVEGGEVDALDASAEGPDHFLDLRVFDMGYGDAFPKAGGAVLFTLDESGDNLFDGVFWQSARIGEGLDQLGEDGVAVGGFKFGLDSFLDNEFTELHLTTHS
jgi:hypothetical protein